MAEINAYLMFRGNCREAMEFYHNCLGGELSIQSVGDSPMGEQAPPEAKNKIMHAQLKGDGWRFFGSDMMDDSPATQSNTVSVCMVGANIDEIKPAFDKLSQGGKVTHDLKKEFFGTYGDLVDKYGFIWMFQADSPAQS